MPWKFLEFLLLGWVSVARGQNVTLTVDDVPVVIGKWFPATLLEEQDPPKFVLGLYGELSK